MSFLEEYSNSLVEFESITTKKAATIKNKGKEDGIKKIKLLFKQGKDLNARCSDYDLAFKNLGETKNRHMNALEERADAKNTSFKYDPKVTRSLFEKALTAYEAAFKKLVEGLKANRTDTTKQFNAAAGKDADGKKLAEGLDIFLSRLEKLQKHANMQRDLEVKNAKAVLATGVVPPAVGGANDTLKRIYMTLAKGIPETEASMKSFIAKPSREKMLAAFTGSTNTRSLGTAATNWKQNIVGKHPAVASKLTTNPDDLVRPIKDMVNNNSKGFWDAKLQTDQDGWEDRAKSEARACLAELPKWVKWAKDVKALIQ